MLDVNVGLPEIHEPSMMEEAVRELQAIIDLPLQIDTSDMEAMERAMRIYNGKPLINSVNGKEESMSRVFPLMAKYGGVAVGLCLDESGIPDTAEGRLAVGRKIIERAAEYGIGPEDIILDGLCMTVSSDSKGAPYHPGDPAAHPGRAGSGNRAGGIQHILPDCPRGKSSMPHSLPWPWNAGWELPS